MAELVVTSKRFGVVRALLDPEDYERVIALGGRWCVVQKRGRFYFQKRIRGHLIELQRFIMQPPTGLCVDHINGDTLDNRRMNLRTCTHAANLRNGRLRTNNTSGVKGVYWDRARGLWNARIRVNYRTVHLGRFTTLEAAAHARRLAEQQYWSD